MNRGTQMKRKYLFLFAFIFGISLISIHGCVTSERASVKIENSLPEKQLVYYNDPFDKLREDLWERAAPVHQRHSHNYKVADMTIENGRLVVITKTASFSSGGLATKYTLKGDFDVQIDCRIDFLSGKRNMDQIMYIVASEKGVKYWKSHGVFITVNKKGKGGSGVISSGRREMGRLFPGTWFKIDNFHGSLRIARVGHEVTTFYMREGMRAWRKMDTFESTRNDLMINFGITNFLMTRNSISAESKLKAQFDNFKINGAQEIIESDI
jgi:hypothetical protein